MRVPANDSGWLPITLTEPKRGETVLTSINDRYDIRNVQRLTRGNGKLWFLDGGSMYVYYEPTHYKPSAPAPKPAGSVPGDAGTPKHGILP